MAWNEVEMAQNLKIDEELDEMPDYTDAPAEEIPEIPAPKKAGARKKAAFPRAVPKEFDLRAAHQAWKEKNGIEDDYTW
jgi:hypothetical protein